MRLIDAEALEKEGWIVSRHVQKDTHTMLYEVKKPGEFPTIELTCEDAISRSEVLDLINDMNEANGFSNYAHYEYMFDVVESIPNIMEVEE